MPTRAENKALLFLTALIALGAGTRLYRSRRAPPAADSIRALDAQRAAADSTRRSSKKAHGKGSSHVARKSRRDSAAAKAAPRLVDLDVAPVESIVKLPRVGPGLARRIVDYRDTAGAFGSMERLRKVP